MKFKPTCYTVCISCTDSLGSCALTIACQNLISAGCSKCGLPHPRPLGSVWGWCSVLLLLPSHLPECWLEKEPAQWCWWGMAEVWRSRAGLFQHVLEPKSGRKGSIYSQPLHLSFLDLVVSVHTLPVCEGTRGLPDVNGVVSRKLLAIFSMQKNNLRSCSYANVASPSPKPLFWDTDGNLLCCKLWGALITRVSCGPQF